ncbi:MAG: periplasmic protein TonB [Thermodesulfobacteriota bacterium]|nr:periplasmic protein TonB [Thermodesulfobacteriota bacterium]
MKRLLFSIALALAVHGLVFYFDGKWLKTRPHHQTRTPRVTISLISLPLPAVTTDSRPLYAPGKKAEDIPGKLLNAEKVPEPPDGKPEVTDASLKKDITQPSGSSESNALSDLPPSSATGKGYMEGDPKNESKVLKEAHDHTSGEMQPGSRFVKEAVPLYKENPSPVYPLQAKKRGHEGTVILEVQVTKEGRAGKVSVFQSSRYPLLDQAAVSSVEKWRFEPGKRGDKKVDMPVKIPVRFQLEGD